MLRARGAAGGGRRRPPEQARPSAVRPPAGAHRASPCGAACAAGRCRPTRSRCGRRCCPWWVRGARLAARGAAPILSTPRRPALRWTGLGLQGGDSGGAETLGAGPGAPQDRQTRGSATSGPWRPRSSSAAQAPERGAVALGAQPPPWESGGLLARDPRIPAPWAVRGRRARSAAPLAWLALAEWSRVTAAQTHSRPCCPWPAGEHVTGPAGGGWLRRRQQTGARKVRPGCPPRLCPRLSRNDSEGR